MVRLMLTLTPVVCMLSAIAFSNVFERYLGDDMKRENPPIEDSSDEDDKRNPGNLYDKVRGGSRSYEFNKDKLYFFFNFFKVLKFRVTKCCSPITCK